MKFYSGLFSVKKPGVSGLLFRTFSPDFSPETLETPGKSAEIPDFPVRFA
jgi:hypothetical protein